MNFKGREKQLRAKFSRELLTVHDIVPVRIDVKVLLGRATLGTLNDCHTDHKVVSNLGPVDGDNLRPTEYVGEL